MITDYSMPHLNGLQLARAVVAVRTDIPVLMLTGFVDDLPDDVLRESGVRHVLRKPVALPELASAMRVMLQAQGPKVR